MTRKLILTTIAAAALTLSAAAQTAREVLDATASRMTAEGAVRATFRATQFQGMQPTEETSGTMLISGRKFQMTTDDILVWFDGRRQWSMMRDATEVNLTTPTDEEVAAVNPATLVGIYRKGYTATLTRSTLRGRPTYVVHLKATNPKAEFSDIYIDSDQASFTPMCIRAKQNGNWVRLAILTFATRQKVRDADFEFQKKQHPGVEVIDMQ